MASVLNRTTKEFRRFANTPDFPPDDWIVDPDLSAVTGFDSRYWTVSGDDVTLMSRAQRDAIDAATLETQKDAIADTIEVDPYLTAFALVLLDEINALRAAAVPPLPPRTARQIKTAVRSKL